MVRRYLRHFIVFLVSVTVCVTGSFAAPSAVIEEDNVNVKFEFSDKNSAYLIGFTDDPDNPKENVINETFLKVNHDDGYAYDDEKLYVFWEITSVIPFELSLVSDKDDITLSWTNKEDDVILETSSSYSKRDCQKIDIKTVKNITELPIAKYDWTLTLGIKAT